MRATWLSALIVLLSASVPVHAQLPLLEKVFANVSDANAYRILGWLSGDPAGLTTGTPGAKVERGGLRGFGFEVSFGAGGLGRSGWRCDLGGLVDEMADTGPGSFRQRAKDRFHLCKQLDALVRSGACRRDSLAVRLASDSPAVVSAAVDTVAQCRKAGELLPRSDTTRTLTSVGREENAAGEATGRKYTETVTITPGAPPDPLFGIEVALAFAHLSGFRGQDTLADVRGSIQELPALAAYLTYLPSNPTFYLGVRGGLVSLHGLRAHVLDTSGAEPVNRIYAGTGTTYLLGGIIGLLLDLEQVGLFAEYAYTHREVPSVEWTSVGNNAIPAILPRRLKLNTDALHVGAQVALK